MSTAATPNQILRVGLQSRGFRDIYHFLLDISWSRFLGLVAAVYLVVNLVFAVLYELVGGIEAARPGSFADFFFFSIQTFGTIGYGKLVPVSMGANLLVTLESFLGLLGIAIITGLIFAKFSRPTAAVMFTENLLLTHFEGKPSLMFRVANERTSQIVEARLRVVMMSTATTAEGHPIRRMVDLKLLREQNAFFSLTWLAVHPIEPGSPLFGMTLEGLAAAQVMFNVSLVGIEEITGQTVHARRWYTAADVRPDVRFADIIGPGVQGQPTIDYGKFHVVEPSTRKLEMPLGT